MMRLIFSEDRYPTLPDHALGRLGRDMNLAGSRNPASFGLASTPLGRINRPAIHWEDVMTRNVQRDPQSVISRRTLVHGMAIAAGATVVGTADALAQQGGQLGPPTTITTPPRSHAILAYRTNIKVSPSPCSA